MSERYVQWGGMGSVIGCEWEPREQGRVEGIPTFGNNSELAGPATAAEVDG